MANYSKDENQKTMTDFLCSPELTEGIHGELRWAASLNIFMSITAFIGNALFLVALNKMSSLHPPTKLLFRTLATTDLCVGIICQPLTVVALLPEVKQYVHVCRYTSTVRFLVSYALCMVSLLTSTAINVDRLFALLLKIRYRQFVTLKRTYVIVALFWVISIAFTVLGVFVNWISALYWTVVLLSCMAISAFSYGRIFFVLRFNQNELRSPAFWQKLYRKTVYTVLYIQLALVVCYLPYTIITLLVSRRSGHPNMWLLLVWRYLGTLVYFNSSLNPVLYCWKMREVKKAMKKIVQRICCSWCCNQENGGFVVNSERQTTSSSL
ncbi:adenosine receptor A3-like [Montipora capricornis]|uniref:adenosine receptor A3-like n=1 Tax=Montipora capricornis TaxID=246305 RepID=UPI0035F19887